MSANSIIPSNMSTEDFVRSGFLQELNRRFLNPAGLHMEILEDDKIEILDYRSKPEYCLLAEEEIDHKLALKVHQGIVRSALARWKKNKFVIQPTNDLEDPEGMDMLEAMAEYNEEELEGYSLFLDEEDEDFS